MQSQGGCPALLAYHPPVVFVVEVFVVVIVQLGGCGGVLQQGRTRGAAKGVRERPL